MGLFGNLRSNPLNPQLQLELIQTAAQGKLDWIVSGRNRLKIYNPEEDDILFKDLEARVVSCGIIYLPHDGMDSFENNPKYLEALNNYSTLNLAFDDAIIIVFS